MPGFELLNNEKFSLIFVPTNFIDNNLPDSIEVFRNIWYLKQLPFSIPEHWQRWLGEIIVENLADRGLFFITKLNSNTPDILDSENVVLNSIMDDFYTAFLLSDFLRFSNNIIKVTGSKTLNDFRVMQFSLQDSHEFIPGFRYPSVDENSLKLAGRIYSKFICLPRKRLFKRFNRSLYSFNLGLLSQDATRRIHSFVRCVEGFIFPERGKSTHRFLSRSQVFLSCHDRDLLKEIYEIRSAVSIGV